MLKRTEVPNHTPEQVNDHIAQALELVNAHELTPDERAALLPHVFVMLGGKQIVMEQIVAGAGIALPNNGGL